MNLSYIFYDPRASTWFQNIVLNFPREDDLPHHVLNIYNANDYLYIDIRSGPERDQNKTTKSYVSYISEILNSNAKKVIGQDFKEWEK